MLHPALTELLSVVLPANACVQSLPCSTEHPCTLLCREAHTQA